MKLKLRRVCIFLLLMILLVPFGVSAAVDSFNIVTWGDDAPYVYYSSNGAYRGIDLGSGSYTVYKYYVNGNSQVPVYCAQFSKLIANGIKFNRSSALSGNSETAIIVGKALSLANKESWGMYEKYLYKTELVNYLLGYNSSKDFVTGNSKLEAIVKEAREYVKNTAKLRSDLPKITLSTANNNDEMKYMGTSGSYVSEKISLSGLVANYGGGVSSANGDTTYTITVSASGGATASICTNAAGTSCSEGTTRRLSKPSGTNSFYVKVTGANDDTVVTIKAAGSNTSRYESCLRYDPDDDTYQIVVVPDYSRYPRSVKASLELTVSTPDIVITPTPTPTPVTTPSVTPTVTPPGVTITPTPDTPTPTPTPSVSKVSHRITIKKVDESGNPLTGSELVLYRANKNDASNAQVGADLAKNTNGAYSFKYSVSNVKGNDDFFDYKYCVKENAAPKGYLFPKPNPKCFTFGDGESGSTCYTSSGEEAEIQYCASVIEGCSDDFERDGNTCRKTVIKTPTSHQCSEGTLTETDSGNVCKIDRGDAISDGAEGLTCENPEYTVDNGKCYETKAPDVPVCEGGSCEEVIEDANKLICKYNDQVVDKKYCLKENNQYTTITRSGNNVTIRIENYLTSVSISKEDVAHSKEVPGAKLKICADKPDEKGKCTPVKLVQKGLFCPGASEESSDVGADTGCTYNPQTDTRTIDVSWTSSSTPREWRGLETGKKYYLVETTPPRGYKVVTISTEFMINADGTVKSGKSNVEGGLLVLDNELTEVTISKDDIATSKELPGATISICDSYKDKNGKIQMSVNEQGECLPAVLADGTPATWTSGNEPHKVVGLAAGTYVLVEKIAPEGYSTAESIVFTLNADGTLSDANGKSLKDTKIVMHDKKIGDVKTGMFGYYVIFLILSIGVVGSFGCYYYLKKKDNSLV